MKLMHSLVAQKKIHVTGQHQKSSHLQKKKKKKMKQVSVGVKSAGLTICQSSYGNGNLRQHTINCARGDMHRSASLSQSEGSKSMRSSKIHRKKFHKQLIVAIIKHDLLFQFVGYKTIRASFLNLCEDINLNNRNFVKANVFGMCKRMKVG